jgi:two-component system, OmpR family, phosphate regulon response regulator OmpR
MAQRVLIIDDDTRLTAMLAEYLAAAGFKVEAEPTAREGLAALRRQPSDLLILDLMLPDADGFDVCRQIRAQTDAISDIPILMLTARGEETDRVVGLEIGADDYLSKPFSTRELLARLRALLRRRGGVSPTGPAAPAMLRFGHLEIDRGSRAVQVEGRNALMTGYQFDLLVALAEHAGRVLSRAQLMDMVKGEELEAFDRSIDVHISRIRAAIESDPKHPRRIITVRGAGYVFARSQDEGA